MTAAQLRAAILQADPESHFFDRKTMRFFGDTMRNYGVRRTTVTTYDGGFVEVWELYRRRSVKHGLRSSSYWDIKTYHQVHGVIE